MAIVLHVRNNAPMTQIVEQLNAMTVTVVGGRLESAVQKRNGYTTFTLALKMVSSYSGNSSPHMT